MTKKTIHGLAYRVWNQMRLAHHVDSYFQIYDEVKMDARQPESFARVLNWMSGALYQTMIVHLAMSKSNQGVSLYKLIAEAKEIGKIDDATASRLRDNIDMHASVLQHIGHQRNNLIAHRSNKRTFAEIHKAYPVTTEDLRALVSTYYSVTEQLYAYVPFQNPWILSDERTAARAMIDALQGTGIACS